jgi:putative glycosyltransferase (TIGR04348 family)
MPILSSKPLIEIVTPAPPGSLHGNRITALRWQGFLKNLDYSSRLTQSWSGNHINLLIALHAYRSHSSILQFKQQYPNQPVILIMTGTDLYRDLLSEGEVRRAVRQSMQLASQIVLLQSASLDRIPQEFVGKASVIYQSTKGVTRKPPPKRHFQISVIGHLRPEKDPFCITRALPYLSSVSTIKVSHLGKAMSPQMQAHAKECNTHMARYRWLDEQTHAKTMQILSRSHVMAITSLMEGGAHVVTEAIAIGVPVIATDIAGNRGLLGDDYPGYYPVGDEKALAKLLQKAENDPAFYQSLEKAIQRRRKLVQPAFEMRSIKDLLSRCRLN